MIPSPVPAERSAGAEPPPVVDSELLFDFSVCFVDEVGDPISGLDLRFSGRGEEESVTTAGDGAAQVKQKPWSLANVDVVSLERLRDLMKPRWSRPRAPSPPVGPRVEVRRFDDEIGTVSLDPNQRTTVVVCPYSTCAQVPGTQFSFGGSFVLPSAVSQLSGIARILQGAAMRTALIYGHTDRAGNDLLNKQLSERRAKAVYAVLRHDTEAWEELWSGTRDVDPWYEHWGTTEGQIMLNALGARDAEGNPLDEDGKAGPCTRAAIQRFQRGDYPKRPAEQAPLPESGTLDAATRRELFLAYAKLVSRQPLDPSCFAQVDGSAFMGCGEFNPISLSAEDAESRRVTVLIFGPAAEPQGLPCRLGSLSPCQGQCGPAPETEEDVALDGAPPYRCPVYQALALECPNAGGAALTHDLVIRVPFALSDTSLRPEIALPEPRSPERDFFTALALDLAELPADPGPRTQELKLEADQLARLAERSSKPLIAALAAIDAGLLVLTRARGQARLERASRLHTLGSRLYPEEEPQDCPRIARREGWGFVSERGCPCPYVLIR